MTTGTGDVSRHVVPIQLKDMAFTGRAAVVHGESIGAIFSASRVRAAGQKIRSALNELMRTTTVSSLGFRSRLYGVGMNAGKIRLLCYT